jgi:hypothetical protein
METGDHHQVMVEAAEVRHTATQSANDDGERGRGSAVEKGA